MSGYLFIRPDEHGEHVSWLLCNAQREPLGEVQHSLLEALATDAHGFRVVLLLPGSRVLLTTAQVPTRNRQRLLKAIPYALEERLIDDVDSQHFALGDYNEDKSVNIAVVDQSYLDNWLERLQAANLQPDAVVPDTLSVPRQDNEWTVLAENTLCTVRTGPQAGFAVDPANLMPMLERALQETPDEARPERIQILDGCVHVSVPIAETQIGPEDAATALYVTPCATHVLVALAAELRPERSLNLLQGRYNVRSKAAEQWRGWVPAAAMLAVWLVVQGVVSVTQYVSLNSESRGLQQEIAQVFQKSFPGSRKVSDLRQIRSIVKQKVSQFEGDTGSDYLSFLQLLDQTAPLLKKVAKLELRQLNYRRGQLDVEFTVGDLQTLEKLKDQIQRTGFNVEIRSANSQDGVVSSRMRITGKVG